MQTEICEVFVVHSDAINHDHVPTTVGIAALEPRTAPVPANVKCLSLPSLREVLKEIGARLKSIVFYTTPVETHASKNLTVS
jgi:hypothetical protein